MKDARKTRTKTALVAAAAIAAGAALWSGAKAEENYVTIGAGTTLISDHEDGPVSIDGEMGWSGNIAYGRWVNERMRAEAELSYLTFEGEGKLGQRSFNLEGEGVEISTNALFDIGPAGAPWALEAGFGIGWMFGGDACADIEGMRYCTDVDDDWTVQGIVGATLDVTERGTLGVRYRLRHAGGFDEEKRMHAFTVGYRVRF